MDHIPNALSRIEPNTVKLFRHCLSLISFECNYEFSMCFLLVILQEGPVLSKQMAATHRRLNISAVWVNLALSVASRIRKLVKYSRGSVAKEKKGYLSQIR